MMFKKTALLILAALAMAACNDNNEDGRPQPPVRPTPPDGYVYANDNEAIGDKVLTAPMLFMGSSEVVTKGKDGKYTDPAAQFEFKTVVGGSEIYLYMHATRFAAAMPGIEMRLTAPHIIDKGTLTMSGLSLTPQNYLAANEEWVENSKYTITAFKSLVNGTVCTVSFTCAGTFDVTYKGYLIVKK